MTATDRAMCTESEDRVSELEAAIAEHRAEILMGGKHQFDVNEADEKLWRLITPAADEEDS